jgi:hypothetical protein
MSAIYATPIIESINRIVTFPTRYKKHQDVIEKKNVDMLPQHHLYDCTIDLQKNTEPPFELNYNL